MILSRRLIRGCVVTFAALLLASCGGSQTMTEDQYQTKVSSDVLDPIIASLQAIGPLLDDIQNRPALILNDQWRADFNTQLRQWQTIHTTLNGMTPPPRFTNMHSSLLRATECLSDFADQIKKTLSAHDQLPDDTAVLIQSCADLMNDAIDVVHQTLSGT